MKPPQPPVQNKAPESELAQTLSLFRKTFITVGAFSFFINFLLLTPSVYMLQVYDRVLSSRNLTTLVALSIIVVGIYLFLAALEWVRSMVLIRVGAKLDLALDGRVFEAAFQRNLTVAGANAGQALGDLTNVRQFLTGNGLFAFFDAPWTPLYLVVIFLFHPLLGIAATAGAILLLILAIANELVTRGPLGEAQKAGAISSAQATSHLRNAEVIEAMGMLPAVRRRWFQAHSEMLAKQAQASERGAVVSSTTRFIRYTLQSAILGLGAFLALDNTITPGMMIAASILMGRALAPVELAISTWRQFVGARGAYNRLDELLKLHPEREEGMSLPAPKGVVTAENMAVVPPGGSKPVLAGLNFAINPGEVVGVIGPSASGKSSLARAMVGVWPTAVGAMRLDGAEVYHWNKAEVGPFIGYLPQDIELFDGTVAENIARFGEVDSEQVIEAARLAGVHEMILKFKDGYDTEIGQAGGVLSGGQRQRIAFARAVYGNPSLIVLDEPNSNLDDVGEAALVQALIELRKRGKTVVVITHRTSILATIDRLMVLKDGQLAAFGTRDEVVAALGMAPRGQQPGAPGRPNVPGGPPGAPGAPGAHGAQGAPGAQGAQGGQGAQAPGARRTVVPRPGPQPGPGGQQGAPAAGGAQPGPSGAGAPPAPPRVQAVQRVMPKPPEPPRAA